MIIKLIFWAGVLFFLGSSILVAKKFDDLQVERNGRIVKMRIEKMPRSCLGGKAFYFASMSYNEHLFDKQIDGNFCDQHHVGEVIDMKYLEGYSVILFPEESVTKQIYFGVILGLFGVAIVFFQWRKIKELQ